MGELEGAGKHSGHMYYPPGGILIWIVIFLELSVFAIASMALAYYSTDDPVRYHTSRLMLDPTFGVINTVLLLTSGYFMARSLDDFKQDRRSHGNSSLLLTILGGLLFLVIKMVEYSQKIDAGLTLGYDTFFNFYWLLTGFHVVHVLIGLVILGFIYFGVRRKSVKPEDFEAGAAFWHMCDLIWLLIFPMLYLVL